MKPYYVWKATLNDGSTINQFEGEKETLFAEVDKNKDKLDTFRLDGEDGSFYEADFINAEIDCNGKVGKSILNPVGKLELIYSRRSRVRVEIGKGTPLDSRTTHRIGLKDDEQEIVIEIFPGLEMAEKKVEIINKKKSAKNDIVEDITKEV